MESKKEGVIVPVDITQYKICKCRIIRNDAYYDECHGLLSNNGVCDRFSYERILTCPGFSQDLPAKSNPDILHDLEEEYDPALQGISGSNLESTQYDHEDQEECAQMLGMKIIEPEILSCKQN